jgi:hypothetical protein
MKRFPMFATLAFASGGSVRSMLRIAVFVVATSLAGCSTQGLTDNWHLSEKQAIAIANGALAANGFEPSKYRWH